MIIIKRRFWTDRITIRSNQLDNLYDTRDNFEAQGYSAIKQKTGYELYNPFFHPNDWAVDMRKNIGQLEQRLDGVFKGG